MESQASFSREEPDEIKTNDNAMLTGWKEKVREHERKNSSHLRHLNVIYFAIIILFFIINSLSYVMDSVQRLRLERSSTVILYQLHSLYTEQCHFAEKWVN